MLKDYDVHPFLDKEKFFQYTPPSDIDFSNLPPVPHAWLLTLNSLCYSHLGIAEPAQNHFERHLNTSNSPALQHALAIIYHRLTGQLDTPLGPLTEGAKRACISQVIEDINPCSNGFMSRVNNLSSMMQRQLSLPGLIYHVRMSFVVKVATRTIQRQSVHAQSLECPCVEWSYNYC